MTDFWQQLAAAPPGQTLQIAHDPEGVSVALGSREWRHILRRHPEMNDFRDLIVDAVNRPVAREPDVRQPGVWRFYSHVPFDRTISSRELPLRVRVVVKFIDEQDGLKGYVSTAFLTR